jgi:hypothetical protein
VSNQNNEFTGLPKHILDMQKDPNVEKIYNIRREAEYTLEELKEVYENPHQLTEEEMKNTFIEDDEPIDLSKLKINKL